MNWSMYFKVMMLINQVAVIMMDGRITLQEALGLINMGLNMAGVTLPGQLSFKVKGDSLYIYVGDDTWFIVTYPALEKLKIDLG